MIERDLMVERLSGTELAVIADHAGLDCATAQKLDDAGDNAGMWKVYCLNPLMGLGQHFAAVQLEQRQVRYYLSQYRRFELVEQEIIVVGQWLHSLRLAGGSAKLSVTDAYGQSRAGDEEMVRFIGSASKLIRLTAGRTRLSGESTASFGRQTLISLSCRAASCGS